jgi:hypothetical protein
LQKRALTTNTFSLIPETNKQTNKETGKVSQNQAKKRTKVLSTDQRKK